jgi:nucleoside-diphosphate-sugar epimerase
LQKKNNAKILITSTSEIYGNPLINPQSEEYFGNVNTVGPRACYDESKRLCETLMYEYKRMYNLDTKIVRLFNTYGVNMKINDGRVVSNLINQALNNNELTINGDGSQTRSFCYITDTIDGLIKIMNSDLSGPINIGNTDEITINQLSNIILKLTKSKSLIKFKNLPNDDPEMRRPDIKKANKMLEWYPKVNITNGLKMTIEYFSKIQE